MLHGHRGRDLIGGAGLVVALAAVFIVLGVRGGPAPASGDHIPSHRIGTPAPVTALNARPGITATVDGRDIGTSAVRASRPATVRFVFAGGGQDLRLLQVRWGDGAAEGDSAHAAPLPVRPVRSEDGQIKFTLRHTWAQPGRYQLVVVPGRTGGQVTVGPASQWTVQVQA